MTDGYVVDDYNYYDNGCMIFLWLRYLMSTLLWCGCDDNDYSFDYDMYYVVGMWFECVCMTLYTYTRWIWLCFVMRWCSSCVCVYDVIRSVYATCIHTRGGVSVLRVWCRCLGVVLVITATTRLTTRLPLHVSCIEPALYWLQVWLYLYYCS